MSERDFIYWLQGFLELSEVKAMDEKQVQIVKDHLKLVMFKTTPDRTQQIKPQDLKVPNLGDFTIIC